MDENLSSSYESDYLEEKYDSLESEYESNMEGGGDDISLDSNYESEYETEYESNMKGGDDDISLDSNYESEYETEYESESEYESNMEGGGDILNGGKISNEKMSEISKNLNEAAKDAEARTENTIKKKNNKNNNKNNNNNNNK